MFEFAGAWETPFNYIFLVVTAVIAWHGIHVRNPDGSSDFVHTLFGCIAAVFFFMVLLKDILGVMTF